MYLPKNSIWIWKSKIVEAGNFDKLIQKCLDHNIDCLLVKAGDSVRNDQYWSKPNAKSMIEKAHAAGLRIGVWAYNKPTTWPSEAHYLTECAEEGIDLIVLDPEIEYEQDKNGATAAKHLMETLRSNLGNDFPILFAPFSLVEWHGPYPYRQFLKYCDAVMTQDYWTEMGRTVDNVLKLRDQQWRNFFIKNPDVKKPLIGILNTYGKEYAKSIPGTLTKQDLLTYMRHNKEGFSSYSYDAAGPTFWQALKEFNQENRVSLPPLPEKPAETVLEPIKPIPNTPTINLPTPQPIQKVEVKSTLTQILGFLEKILKFIFSIK